MKRLASGAVFAAVMLSVALFDAVPVQTAGGQSCEALTALTLPNTTITSATLVAAGAFSPPAGNRAGRGTAANAYAKLPAFCRVAATLAPSSDSDIKVEVWLPAAGWNGKFEAVGNGGWAGSISYPALAAAVAAGDAA